MDQLKIDKINRLPHPLTAVFYGGDEWEIYSICVETGLMKINVVGMLDNCHFDNVKKIKDIDGGVHDADDFWID